MRACSRKGGSVGTSAHIAEDRSIARRARRIAARIHRGADAFACEDITIVAGAWMGLNRSERGHEARLRASLLGEPSRLCRDASGEPAAATDGESVRFLCHVGPHACRSEFSGIGFIGADAIVRRDNFLAGVTLKLVEQHLKQGRVAKLLIVTGAKANETKVPDEVHA